LAPPASIFLMSISVAAPALLVAIVAPHWKHRSCNQKEIKIR
jgi:hypothetical protein